MRFANFAGLISRAEKVVLEMPTFGRPKLPICFCVIVMMTDDALPKINVLQAVSIASARIKELYEDQNPQNVLLEEVRFEFESNRWEITIGFSHKANLLPASDFTKMNIPIGEMPSYDPDRTYKLVKVDGTSGAVLALGTRTL